MTTAPYLVDAPALPEHLRRRLDGRRATSPVDEAECDRHLALIKRRIRERREAWERQAGHMVEVEPVTVE